LLHKSYEKLHDGSVTTTRIILKVDTELPEANCKHKCDASVCQGAFEWDLINQQK